MRWAAGFESSCDGVYALEPVYEVLQDHRNFHPNRQIEYGFRSSDLHPTSSTMTFAGVDNIVENMHIINTQSGTFSGNGSTFELFLSNNGTSTTLQGGALTIDISCFTDLFGITASNMTMSEGTISATSVFSFLTLGNNNRITFNGTTYGMDVTGAPDDAPADSAPADDAPAQDVATD